MTVDSNPDAASPSKICIMCSKPLIKDWDFCPFCGSNIVPASVASTIDAYVQDKLNIEISNRLKDQNNIVRELADKAEDVVKKRITNYTILIGIGIAIFSSFIIFEGVNTVKNVSDKIYSKVSSRVDPVIANVEKRSNDALQKVSKINENLDNLTLEVTNQSKRIEQTSKQVDTLTIKKAYPTLGLSKFVSLDQRPWTEKLSKKSGEKWINIVIDPRGREYLSSDMVIQLQDRLKYYGFIPKVGSFGVDGPYGAWYGSFLLPYTTNTSLVFFSEELKDDAAKVRDIVSEVLSTKLHAPVFLDANDPTYQGDRKFIIENSGLDMQLSLGVPEK